LMTVENAVGVEKVALADRSSKAHARMANLMIRILGQWMVVANRCYTSAPEERV
jgi:hypothetical protein